MLTWIDERLGLAAWARAGLRKVFPDHWSFLLGEVALFCLVVLVLTGVFLTLFYVPDATTVTYSGPWPPLRGQTVSAAFDSVMRLSFEVRRPGHAPDPPLGGAGLRGGHRGAPA